MIVAALALASTPVRAEPGVSVILLRAAEGRWRAAEERTRDELRVMGVRVDELPDQPELTRLMAEHGALAAVRLQRRGDVTDAQVWLADPAGGEARSHRIDALAFDGGEAAALTALRTAELVHTAVTAHWAEPVTTPPALAPIVVPELAPLPTREPLVPASDAPLPSPPHQPLAPGVPVSDAPRASPALPEDSLDQVLAALRPAAPPSAPPLRRVLGGYATLGGGPGGAGLLVGAALALRWELGRVVAMQAELLAATSPTWIDVTAGSLRVGLAGPRAAVVIEPWRLARVSPRIGLNGGLAISWATGRTASPLRGGRDLAVVGLLGGSLGAALRLGARLRLYLGVDLSFMVPPVALRVAGDEVAQLGAPLVQGVLGLEWSWPAPRKK